ncbi:hypothetical protein [Nocardioides euryhalodurans]|uniref:Lipoprotein n=1 Tax=Nocardioides euryhalodurans TaxID=2518370 RepID=A0A4P7GNT5_9ACTN|nr:hypothetical protein [Nocardioides euryhalodurans]QBR93743.1 hypothetical protein EXE57_16765 [Nocardioides euryhalodurans]
MSRRLIAAAITGVLLLAGCQDEPQPRFADPPDSPSPSESETSAVPEAQSPEEVLDAWLATYTEFESTGEPQALRSLSQACATCEEVIRIVVTAHDRGGYLRSDGWSIKGSPSVIYERPRATGLRAEVEVSPSRYKATANSPVERGTGGVITMEFDLERTNEGWLVSDFTRLPS